MVHKCQASRQQSGTTRLHGSQIRLYRQDCSCIASWPDTKRPKPSIPRAELPFRDSAAGSVFGPGLIETFAGRTVDAWHLASAEARQQPNQSHTWHQIAKAAAIIVVTSGFPRFFRYSLLSFANGFIFPCSSATADAHCACDMQQVNVR